MKNIQNALLLKHLMTLEQLGFRYTDEDVITHDGLWFDLPADIKKLKEVSNNCHLCQLSKARSCVLFGHGNVTADLMFIGYSPNEDEDSSRNIFGSKRGEMLTMMIEKVIGLKIADVYYTNMLKCLPLRSLNSLNNELLKCRPFMDKQIDIINPRLIVCLGEKAFDNLLGNKGSFASRRGEIFRLKKHNVIAIHDPDYLERNPSAKKETMISLKSIKSFLEKGC